VGAALAAIIAAKAAPTHAGKLLPNYLYNTDRHLNPGSVVSISESGKSEGAKEGQ